MDLLLTILLFIIHFPLFRFAFGVWRQIHHIKKQFGAVRDQFEEARRAQQQYYTGDDDDDDDDDGYYASPRAHAGRVQFMSSIAESVNFEEIIEDRPALPYNPDAKAEPQISDAHFEEL